MNTPRHLLPAPRRLVSPRGLSLFELMISLAITSMLLVAVATSFSASSSVIQANDEFFRASQAARVTMNALLTEIRRCDDIDVYADHLDIGTASDGTTPGRDVQYYFYPATKKLTYCPDAAAATKKEYTLASNIKSAKFTADYNSVNGGPLFPVRVTVELVVEVGDNQVLLTGSAAPRRSMDWN